RAAGDNDGIERVVKIVAALLHGRIILRGPVEEQERWRDGKGLQLGLEARQHHPEDREEDQEAGEPGGGGRDHLASRRYRACHAYASRFRPTMRTRKKATMLAMTTATRPPAEALPTSYWISACA